MSGSISSPFAFPPQTNDFLHRLPPGNSGEDPSMVMQPPSGNYPTYSAPDVRQRTPTEDQGYMPTSAQQPDWSFLLHPVVLHMLHQHLMNLFNQQQLPQTSA